MSPEALRLLLEHQLVCPRHQGALHLLDHVHIIALKEPVLEVLQGLIPVLAPLLIFLLPFGFVLDFDFCLELLSELLDVLRHLVVLGELVVYFELQLSLLLVHGRVLKLLQLRFQRLLLTAELAEELQVLLLDLLLFLVQDVSVVDEALVNGAFLLQLPVSAAVEVYLLFQILEVELVAHPGGLQRRGLVFLVQNEEATAGGLVLCVTFEVGVLGVGQQLLVQ